MSDDDAAMYDEAAKELTPPKILERVNEHNKAITATVGTVGTLLAGLGGVTAAVSINRTTLYWGDIPVVPVGALLTSVFAGLAVGLALIGRRPVFTWVSRQRLEQVQDWFEREIARKKKALRWASFFFITAAFTAVATAAVAGIVVIVDPSTNPRNLTALSAKVGDKGVVTIKLSGSVDGLDEDEHLQVTVTPDTDDPEANALVSTVVYPDTDGSASLDSEARAPVGSTQVAAVVVVLRGDETSETYDLSATYAKVPDPGPAAQPTGGDSKAAEALTAAAPAVAAILAAYLTRTGGKVPSAISKGLKAFELAAWAKDQVDLLKGDQLTPEQEATLKAIRKWQRAEALRPTFRRNVGALFVWMGRHQSTPPAASVVVDTFTLGRWANNQRLLYATGDLAPARVALLESVPGWTWTLPPR